MVHQDPEKRKKPATETSTERDFLIGPLLEGLKAQSQVLSDHLKVQEDKRKQEKHLIDSLKSSQQLKDLERTASMEQGLVDDTAFDASVAAAIPERGPTAFLTRTGQRDPLNLGVGGGELSGIDPLALVQEDTARNLDVSRFHLSDLIRQQSTPEALAETVGVGLFGLAGERNVGVPRLTESLEALRLLDPEQARRLQREIEQSRAERGLVTLEAKQATEFEEQDKLTRLEKDQARIMSNRLTRSLHTHASALGGDAASLYVGTPDTPKELQGILGKLHIKFGELGDPKLTKKRREQIDKEVDIMIRAAMSQPGNGDFLQRANAVLDQLVGAVAAAEQIPAKDRGTGGPALVAELKRENVLQKWEGVLLDQFKPWLEKEVTRINSQEEASRKKKEESIPTKPFQKPPIGPPFVRSLDAAIGGVLGNLLGPPEDKRASIRGRQRR
jgi:hypothetical protein